MNKLEICNTLQPISNIIEINHTFNYMHYEAQKCVLILQKYDDEITLAVKDNFGNYITHVFSDEQLQEFKEKFSVLLK